MARIRGAVFLLVAWLAAPVTPLPDGPPEAACRDLMPGTEAGQSGIEGHLSPSQNIRPTWGNSKTPPYYIQVHAQRYTPYDNVNVSVVANQTTGHNMYRGLIMQALRVTCRSEHETQVEGEPVGTFSIFPGTGEAGNSLLRTMDCLGEEENTVSHNSPQYKINETVLWRAPDDMAGHLVFKATIVQSALIYWEDVYSSVLIDPSEDGPAECGCAHLTVDRLLTMVTAVLASCLLTAR